MCAPAYLDIAFLPGAGLTPFLLRRRKLRKRHVDMLDRFVQGLNVPLYMLCQPTVSSALKGCLSKSWEWTLMRQQLDIVFHKVDT